MTAAIGSPAQAASSSSRLPPEAIQIEHHPHVAPAQIVEARREARPVGAGPAAAVVEDAVAPGRVHA